MVDTIRMLPTTRQRTKVRLHNDRAWREASAAWLQRYPICVLCLARGKVNERASEDTCTKQRTLVVDHVEPHRGNEQLFWDQSNWETLCRLCHDVDKQRHEQTGKSGAAWREYLKGEVRRTGSREVVDRLTDHVPGGVWGSSSGDEKA